MNELIAYQNDLIPLLLDSYEAYKLASRHQEPLCTSLNNLLVLLYYQFNPLAINNPTRVSMDEINKYCQLIEKKDKASKVKPKAKPAAGNQVPPQASTSQTVQNQQAPQTSQAATSGTTTACLSQTQTASSSNQQQAQQFNTPN